MELYNFFRSGSSHRLRIALRLKRLDVEYKPINLRLEQHLAVDYRALNPQGLVPTLADNGRALIQTPAIIEWLEERFPTPALLPSNPEDRAHVRALAAIIGCDIHPINNRRVLETLRSRFGADSNAINAWCAIWIESGFNALEVLLATDSNRETFCFGTAPSIADVYLIPQLESARRFAMDCTRWPIICGIDAACAQLDAFRLAAPALQPDAH